MVSLVGTMQRALFLDRDGVINVDLGYVHRTEDFIFMDGIFDVVRAARINGYYVIVVTNQAGIGRGYYNETQFQELTDWMCLRFAEEKAWIDRVYFSPYHPTAGLGEYKQDHVSRKPRPGMLVRAQSELEIDLSASIFIGDKLSDMEAGIAAGVGRNLLLHVDGGNIALATGYVQIGKLREALSFIANLQ